MMMAAACNFIGGASRRPARQHKHRRIGGGGRPSHFFYFAGTLAAATLLLLVVFGPPREVAPRRLEKSEQQHQQQRGDSNSRSPGLEIAPSLPEEEKEELPSSSPLVKTRKRQHRVVKYQSFIVDRTPRRGDEDRVADGRHRYAGSGGEGSTGSGGGSSVLELRKSIVLDSYVDKGPASPRRPNSRQGYHNSDVGRSNIDAGSGGKSLADVAAAATTSRHERHLLRGHRHLAKERPWPHPVESIIVEEDGWSNVGEDDDLNLMFYRKVNKRSARFLEVCCCWTEAPNLTHLRKIAYSLFYSTLYSRAYRSQFLRQPTSVYAGTCSMFHRQERHTEEAARIAACPTKDGPLPTARTLLLP
jgi:hypothetical protein